MKFIVEQIAICPTNPTLAKSLLTALGAQRWAEDHVVALGEVFGVEGRNEADLSFNYDLGVQHKPLEFEVLNYTSGPNWMNESTRRNSVSHLGMHCSAEELVRWREFFATFGIAVAQEVMTESHTNPAIKDQRWYNYVIFDTKDILGVDLKLIVRRETR